MTNCKRCGKAFTQFDFSAVSPNRYAPAPTVYCNEKCMKEDEEMIIAQANPYEHSHDEDDSRPCPACAWTQSQRAGNDHTEEQFRAKFNEFFQEQVDAAKAQGFNAGITMEQERIIRVIRSLNISSPENHHAYETAIFAITTSK